MTPKRGALVPIGLASELVGVPVYRLNRWARWGIVPGARKVRHRWYFNLRKLERFVD